VFLKLATLLAAVTTGLLGLTKMYRFAMFLSGPALELDRVARVEWSLDILQDIALAMFLFVIVARQNTK
jgi:hypothetical protein